MASKGGMNGAALALAAAGGLLAYSGVKGYTVTKTLHSFIGGKLPQQQQGVVSPGEIISANAAQRETASASYNQTLAKPLVAAYGWGAQDWRDLVDLWNNESGWSQYAQNPDTGAYGIAQANPDAGNLYPTGGNPNQGSNPLVQITWGLSYIKQRYGSPSAAWQHELEYGWY